jgi:pimeloyl-ACP methyl ester carboxylesterase
MRLFYEQTGSGKPFVLLHAFPLSGKMWKSQIETLIEADFNVITPDLRGFGESHNFADLNSIEDMAKDVADLIEDLEIEKAVFCGLSMGGYVMFNFFRLFPEKVSALIFCDTSYAADSEEKRLTRFDLIEKIEKDGSKALIENMLPGLISDFTKENNPHLVTELERMFSETNPKAAIAALRGMAERKDHSEILGDIKVPTAFIFGEEDKVTNLETAEKMHNEISNSRLFIIKNAGHYSNLEQPFQFNQALSDFLENIQI